MPNFEGEGSSKQFIPGQSSALEQNKEGALRIEVDKADIERVLIDHFMQDLIRSKDEGVVTGYSPNQYLKLPDGKTIHFQLYPEKYMEYLQGEITFEDMISGVSFSETFGEDDENEWESVNVVLTGNENLVANPNSETWKTEHERFIRSVSETTQEKLEERNKRIAEAQGFLKDGDPVKKSVGELLMYLENFCQGRHDSGYSVYSKGIDLINHLSINTEVVGRDKISEEGEEPSEYRHSSSREEMRDMLLKKGRAFRIVQLNEEGQDSNLGGKRVAIIFE